MTKLRRTGFTQLFAIGANVAIGALMLSACSPKFDWRDVRGADASFTILMPGKPVTVSRSIDLDGTALTMTMTAADIDGVSFALGTAELPDAMSAQTALTAMKTAMVKNINGIIRREKSSATAQALGSTASMTTSIEIEASGQPGGGNRVQPLLLFAHFVARDKRVYQAVVIGPEKKISREAVDTFLTSLKLN